jgi:hypothetical protein
MWFEHIGINFHNEKTKDNLRLPKEVIPPNENGAGLNCYVNNLRDC